MSDAATFEARAVVAMHLPGGYTRLEHLKERPGHWQDVPIELVPHSGARNDDDCKLYGSSVVGARMLRQLRLRLGDLAVNPRQKGLGGRRRACRAGYTVKFAFTLRGSGRPHLNDIWRREIARL